MAVTLAVICAVPLLGVGIVDANNNIIANIGLSADYAGFVNSNDGVAKSIDKNVVTGVKASAATNKTVSTGSTSVSKTIANKNSSNTVVSKKKSSNTLTNLSGRTGLSKLQVYMNKKFNHRTGAAHTAVGVEKTKYGDCWGLADWASKKLKANKYTVRVVQGRTSAASNHRWVQAKINGKWINFESSLITKRYGSKTYSKTCARVSRVVKVL